MAWRLKLLLAIGLALRVTSERDFGRRIVPLGVGANKGKWEGSACGDWVFPRTPWGTSRGCAGKRLGIWDWGFGVWDWYEVYEWRRVSPPGGRGRSGVVRGNGPRGRGPGLRGRKDRIEGVRGNDSAIGHRVVSASEGQGREIREAIMVLVGCAHRERAEV